MSPGPPGNVGERRLAPILYLLSFLSGFAALVYEVTWTRLLSLTFGSTTLAASAVLAGFMGGMGLGAALLYRLHDRLGSALKIYGGLEIAIALSAAGFTLAFQPLPQLFAVVAGVLPTGIWLDLFRVAAVFLLLLIPSALMGATYPALCLALIHTRRGLDRHLGMIYGLNTIGAAAGALTAGLVLIELFGLRHAVSIGTTINLSVGLAALALARRSGARGSESPATTQDRGLPTTLPYWLTGAVLFISGFTTLSYEIVWFRALRYLVGNSTYALTNILVVFLLGLGFGALLYRPVLRRVRPERALAWSQLGIALLALAAIGAEHWILSHPEWSAQLSIFSATFLWQPWWKRLLINAGIAAAMMLPATLCMGLSFPVASRLFLGSLDRLGARVGGAYLLANLGSILGAVLAAVLLLPHLGTVGSTQATAVLNLGLGLLLFVWSPGPRRRLAWVAAATGAVVLAGAALPTHLRFVGANLAYLQGDLVFEEEGDLATVQVRVNPKHPEQRGMLIDGTIIGVSRGWYPTIYSKQTLLAHLPLVLDTEIRHSLNVGLGSGSTLEHLASYPSIETLDVVEINAAAVRGAAFFDESEVFQDPRVRIVVEDALHYLLRTPKTYDLIVSDGKQNEDFSGTAKTLSQEFYQHSFQRLAEDGIFIQWVPIGMLPADFEVILRTLASVFPHLEVFYDPPESVLMVASKRPLVGRQRMSEAQFAQLERKEDLERLTISGVAALLSRWVASRPQLLETLGPGPINDWNRMPLEFSAYRATAHSRRGAGATNIRQLLAAQAAGSSETQRALAPVQLPAVRSMHVLRRAFASYLDSDLNEAVRLARQAMRQNPADATAPVALQNFRRHLSPP